MIACFINFGSFVDFVSSFSHVPIDATSNQYIEPSKASNKFKLSDFKQASLGAFAAMTIASNVMAAPAEAVDTFAFSSSTILSEKVVREGLYRDYEVDIVQQKDDAESTFKSAKETKSKKGTFISKVSL